MEVQQNRKMPRQQANDLVKEKSSEVYQIEEPKYEVCLKIEINQEDMRKIWPFKIEKKRASSINENRECIAAERKRIHSRGSFNRAIPEYDAINSHILHSMQGSYLITAHLQECTIAQRD